MNAQPIVSVIVPIYNSEAYLEQCLQSLVAQTMIDFEVVCVNDGSTDSSREIIQCFIDRDNRFRVIDKPNSGYGASMNQGLAASSGEFISILESDDFFEPFALELLYNTMITHNVQVAKANFWFFRTMPKKQDEPFELITTAMANRLVNPQYEFDIYYKKPSIWSAMYKKAFLIEHRINFLETPGASYQDAGFNFKVWSSASRVFFLQDSIIHYRVDNETSSVNSPEKVYCVCDEYDEMRKYLAKHPEKSQYLNNVLTRMKYDTYMWNYDRLSENLQKEFILRFSKDFHEEIALGNLDLSLFYPRQILDLNLILESPLQFHAARLAPDSGNSVREKVSRYYKIGGFPLLFRAFKAKVRNG